MMKKILQCVVFTAFFYLVFFSALVYNWERESAWQAERITRFYCAESGLGAECYPGR